MVGQWFALPKLFKESNNKKLLNSETRRRSHPVLRTSGFVLYLSNHSFYFHIFVFHINAFFNMVKANVKLNLGLWQDDQVTLHMDSKEEEAFRVDAGDEKAHAAEKE